MFIAYNNINRNFQVGCCRHPLQGANMKTLGIISEYNPFHNGHKYHIQAARQEFGAENILCIMSGSFVQRGEPAMFDKWSRAKMAVLNGADLVIELPFVYSCQPAEIFSFGAINTLNNLGIIDGICFGSELGSADPLTQIASMLIKEPKDFSNLVKYHLKAGNTYPRSISLALGDYYLENEAISSDIWENPNNILGIEYIKSILLLKSPMVPYTIKRFANNYNDTEILHTIASATAVRQELKSSGFSEKLQTSLPQQSLSIIKDNLDISKGPIYLDNFSDILLYRIRIMTTEQIKSYISIREGLEHRIKKAAEKARCINELIESIKTKRYTRAFIQRILCHILMDLNWEQTMVFKQLNTPSYCRVLAFNDRGKMLLRNIKDSSQYPIINKVASFNTEDPILRSIFEYDIRSTSIYNLGYSNIDLKNAGEDYLVSPVHV
jgi:predicted nucleotidyltransferase